MSAALRVWLLGLLCVLVWALAGRAPTFVAGGDAPSTEFSAARAGAVLARLLGPQLPHPAASAENAALHARLLAELARLDVPAHTLTGRSCIAGRGGISCATVSDIVADVIPGDGKAILLMAHMDSVAAGPGASDDASGVATILETIRALKSGTSPAGHPVIALFSDGEEMGLLGADLFLTDDTRRAQVGVVVNAEARGNQGPSYLFQTSAGSGKLVDLYARMGQQQQATAELDSYLTYLDSNNRASDALPFLEDLVKEHDDQPLFARALAEQLHRMGRTDEAVSQLDSLGDALLQSGKNKEAAEVITQILMMNPPNAQGYRDLLTQIPK